MGGGKKKDGVKDDQGQSQAPKIKKAPVGFLETSMDKQRTTTNLGGEALVRSERFELPALGIEIRCSIQLSYERATAFPISDLPEMSTRWGTAGGLNFARRSPAVSRIRLLGGPRGSCGRSQPRQSLYLMLLFFRRAQGRARCRMITGSKLTSVPVQGRGARTKRDRRAPRHARQGTWAVDCAMHPLDRRSTAGLGVY